MKINVIFLLLALLAEILGTIGGFGSSVFFVPIGNFYFDFYSVLGLTAIFHLSSNLSKIVLFRKGLNKFLLLYIGVPSDRKSTRLNSSHVKISYAVFCLRIKRFTC